MKYSKFSVTACLFLATLACKRPDPIRLEPTIEEPPTVSSVIRMNDPATTGQLVNGFYDLSDGWRWTGPKFTVALKRPPDASFRGATLTLSCTLPQESINALHQITISSRIAGLDLPPETFTTAGDHTYRRDVPASVFTNDVVTIKFTVDKFIRPPNDGRALALVVTAIAFSPK